MLSQCIIVSQTWLHEVDGKPPPDPPVSKVVNEPIATLLCQLMQFSVCAHTFTCAHMHACMHARTCTLAHAQHTHPHTYTPTHRQVSWMDAQVPPGPQPQPHKQDITSLAFTPLTNASSP